MNRKRQPKHSLIPWRHDEKSKLHVRGSDGRLVAHFFLNSDSSDLSAEEVAMANRNLAVKSVNLHSELVNALEFFCTICNCPKHLRDDHLVGCKVPVVRALVARAREDEWVPEGSGS